MNGAERRARIIDILTEADEPVSGGQLAKRLGVSRQIIVQDMALLRTGGGSEVISTYRGYVLQKEPKVCRKVFKVRHSTADTQRELLEIVDLGGQVEDVFVYHRVYGVVRGQLRISSRRDVTAFMERLSQSSSAPLMQITDEFHYHTVSAADAETLGLIGKRLDELGFLAPLREYEPEELDVP